jgi:intracellular multiplication protein IcmJ
MSTSESSRPLLGSGLVSIAQVQPDGMSTNVLLDHRMVDRIRAAVLGRDHGACRFCGFRAKRYQQVALLDGMARSIAGMATACIMCHDCFHLDRVARHRSGVLLFLPEMEQIELIDLARDLYVSRSTQGDAPSRARRALDHLMTRRDEAKKRIGSDEPAFLAERFEAAARESAEAVTELRRTIAGVRLMPLDRRIVSEDDLEFNQFPQILVYWRSKQGPYKDASKRRFSRITRYLSEVAEVGDDPHD